MKISWTPRAIEDYSKILAYLYETWGAGSVKKFTAQFENTLKSIEKNPGMFTKTLKKKNVHKGFITKHTSLFYEVKIRKKEIILLTFWDNRKDPDQRRY